MSLGPCFGYATVLYCYVYYTAYQWIKGLALCLSAAKNPVGMGACLPLFLLVAKTNSTMLWYILEQGYNHPRILWWIYPTSVFRIVVDQCGFFYA